MPVLDARALETDPEGMALLAGVLRPGKPKRRRRLSRRLPLLHPEEPPIGRELVDFEPNAPRVLTPAE